MSRVHGLLLAAGRSTRMGATNKLLLSVDGVPMVRRVAGALAGAGLDATLAVLGHESDQVAAALPPSFASVVNWDFEEGMGRSLAVGVRALDAGVDGVLVALADTPWLRTETVRSVVAAFRARPEQASIIAPRCAGRRGHPMIFAATHRPRLEACRGDEGAKALLQAHGRAIHWVDVEDEGIWRDVDRPQDV